MAALNADELLQGAPDLELPFSIDLGRVQALSPSEQEELFAQLDAFRAGIKRNPLWRLLPHEGELGYKRRHDLPIVGDESRGQVEYLELDVLDVYIGAVVAGNRFGKTHINVARCAVQTLPRELIPPWLLPYKVLDPVKRDVRFILAGKDSTNWLPTVLKPKLKELLPAEALKGGSVDRAYNQKENILTFADDIGYWDIKTYDMDLQAWAGSETDGVCFDEEPLGLDGFRKYEEAVGRIIDRDGTIRFTLTPVEGIGWLYDLLADEHDQPRRDARLEQPPGETPEVHVVTGNIDHNPNISKRGRTRAKRQWAKNPVTAQQRSEGLWVHREGLIFPEFKRSREQPPDAEIPGGHLRPDRDLWVPGEPSPVDGRGQWLVPVFESIDPGINEEHPFAFSVSFLNTAKTDPYGHDDVLETFYAFKAPDLNVDGQVEVIREARARFGYHPQFTVIDPSAKNRNQETGRHMQEAFRRRRIYTIAGQNDRALTYAEVRSRLTDHRWVIWQSLDPLIGAEMVKYRWRKAPPKSEDAPKAEPVKRYDDLIDTIRYKVLRIPVWRGQAPDPNEDLDANDPKRRLLREHVARVVRNRGKRGKVGGVW